MMSTTHHMRLRGYRPPTHPLNLAKRQCFILRMPSILIYPFLLVLLLHHAFIHRLLQIVQPAVQSRLAKSIHGAKVQTALASKMQWIVGIVFLE